MRHRRRQPVIAERRLHRMDHWRPVGVVAEILFPTPDDLDRAAGGLCNQDRDLREIREQPPPKAAAQQRSVDDDLVVGETQHLLGDSVGDLDALCRDPQLAPIVRHMGRAVHRLHRRVRLHRDFEDSLKRAVGSRQNGRSVARFDFRVERRGFQQRAIFGPLATG